MTLKDGFSRFFSEQPERLHFAAHSHHPWPDVTRAAHMEAWDLAARLADDKWEQVFDSTIPQTLQAVAGVLGIESGSTLTFGPNTHSFLNRIFSCLEPPVRVLTTDSEFHSFQRQSLRWEEAGLALIDRIPTDPFDTFTERFSRELRSGAHDLVYISQVFFNSGFAVPELDRLISSSPNDSTLIVIDGYHGFMAVPTNLGALQDRVFYLAGGYKYAMAGEGVCFLHSPPGYAPRPVNTGWYAGFGQLETGVGEVVPYKDDGSRFAGATYDLSGIFRMKAVLDWLAQEGWTVSDTRSHVQALQERFLQDVSGLGALVPPQPHHRGSFLTFGSDNASSLYRMLHDAGVVTDYRGPHLRLGFGVYHDENDVDRLLEIVKALDAG